MFHDFEEIIFWELWLNKHGGEIKSRVPSFLAEQVGAIVGKSTAQASLSICLIFSLTVLSAFLAAEHHEYGFFLLASGAFFMHGFMHLGQAVALKRYVPAVITSALIIIPYGLVLYRRLINEGMVDLSGLFISFLLGAVLMLPFILAMHHVGDYVFKKVVKLLIK
jgi:hypothetical protein